MLPPNRRPRQVDTSYHFCPHATCESRGWVGLGNLRANGHPNGSPWRQFQCTSCGGYVFETHGTILHSKRVSVDLIVRVIACLVAGLGSRGTARVFETDPNTVLQWLVEAAEQLRAFSRHSLCKVHVWQVQLDELSSMLSDVKAGELSEDETMKRLDRSPTWVWTAMDPESTWLLGIDVGPRTPTMAQWVVHQVAQILAPSCTPLFLTDGYKDYRTTLLTHVGHWGQSPRHHATGPAPKLRWKPRPELCSAQVIKTPRRRCG